MTGELLNALDQICEEKGIEKAVLLEAIEVALVSAYKGILGLRPTQK